MAINPSEYDLEELRGSVGNGEPDSEELADGSPADDTLQASHYRELLLLQNRADKAHLEKPYLRSLPTTYDGELVTFDWLEFLVETGGFKQTSDALRHYRSVGWLTESVEHGLRDYLVGIPESDPSTTRSFDHSDHLRSLIYIGRLATA